MKARKVLSLTLALALCAGLLTAPAGAHDMGKVGKKNVISAGSGHTAAIDANGSLWTWGNNENGQLGSGTTKDSIVPIKVLDNVVTVNCGWYHTAAIKTDGSLWVWGVNGHGSVGDGTTEDRYSPVKVMDNVTAVSCGWDHTAAIKKDGSLWTWGKNEYGRLGNGTTKDSAVPVKIMDGVTAVSCGSYHTAAIKKDGSLWVWGSNMTGQLGNGTTTVSQTPIKVMDNVVAVSGGFYHTAAIKKDGSLWMWGWNTSGQLGNNRTGNCDSLGGLCQTTPVKVLDNAAAVSCGINDTAAIKTDGSLWMWGSNMYGELGNGGIGNWVGMHSTTKAKVACQTTPAKVLDHVASISCGQNNCTIAVKTDGSLWMWGKNEYAQLGNGGGGNSTYSGVSIQTVPIQITLGGNTAAYASPQTVNVDGKPVRFQMYALMDPNGNPTNYVKVRDIANVLDGTPAQFEVGYYSGMVHLVKGWPYTPNGSEMTTPFSGDRIYTKSAAQTNVDGVNLDLDAITLTDDRGGGYTYYKLRDLAQALGFNVGWSAEKGVFLETDKPYDPSN